MATKHFNQKQIIKFKKGTTVKRSFIFISFERKGVEKSCWACKASLTYSRQNTNIGLYLASIINLCLLMIMWVISLYYKLNVWYSFDVVIRFLFLKLFVTLNFHLILVCIIKTNMTSFLALIFHHLNLLYKDEGKIHDRTGGER